jgi:FtsP/CotA-like multicopper oxidase with cupredoxin domain
MNRRSFLSSAAITVGAQLLPDAALAALDRHDLPNYTLRLEPSTIEISPGISIKTIAYNGQVPGPLLRLKEGRQIHIDVTNATANDDLVYWHGVTTDSLNDGEMEESSPMIKPGGTLRYTFNPHPSGTRWYHTHAGAGSDLSRGTYSRQFGFVIIEGQPKPAHYDQEFNLAIHHWNPSFVPLVETMRTESANAPLTTRLDVGYQYATINQHMLGGGEPLRVKGGRGFYFVC